MFFQHYTTLENWKDKVLFYTDKIVANDDLKSNTFGLLFYNENEQFSLHLIPLNEQLSKRILKRKYDYTLFFERVFIEEDDIEYALDVLSLFKLTHKQKLSLSKNVAEEVKQILWFLQQELQKSQANYQIIKSLLKVLLLHLIRFQQSQLLPQDLAQNRVYHFLKLMETHYKTQMNAEFYAQKLGLSVKRLNQILKEKLQHTALQLIKQRQITEIKRELQKKDKSIKEIAYDYNFSSVSAFSRFFKQHTQISPRDFKIWN